MEGARSATDPARGRTGVRRNLPALVAAALALLGAAGDPRRRTLALGAASGMLLSAGVVGIFSIGLPLLLAAFAAARAWRVAAHHAPRAATLASLALAACCPAVLVGGIALT